MSIVKGLIGRESGKRYDIAPKYVCEFDFSPLEVEYDYDEIKKKVSRELIESRPANMWRYREFLPLDEAPKVGLNVGFTPLVKADRLAAALGVKELYVKNDSVSHPTLSFKDRVVAIAINKALEFGFKVVGCASTGNLANSVAAQAASAGLQAVIVIPSDLERGKVVGTKIYGPHLIAVDGTYDDVNRLCGEIAGAYPVAMVNVNIRPFYAEGSKSYGFEIYEQLGWRAPKHIVSPMAGGSLICKLEKAYKEFVKTGLLEDTGMKIYGAQATGCAPITTAFKAGKDFIKPVKTPQTIAKSLAIGNPADAYYALSTMRNSGGAGEDVTDEEILEGIRLLARTEGIFTETAGGVTVGVTKKLIEQGRIPRDESIVICVTGQGLKTTEPLMDALPANPVITPKLADFDKVAGGLFK